MSKEPFPAAARLDQLVQSRCPRFFALRAADPPDQHSPVRWREPLEECPGGLVLFQQRDMSLVEDRLFPLLVRVNARPVLLPGLKRLPPRRPHALRAGEEPDALDIDCAPDTFATSRSEADRVPLAVDALSDAVNPTDTQGLVDRFRPGDARDPGLFPMEADPQLASGRVILLKPFPQGDRGREVRDVDGCWHLPSRPAAIGAPWSGTTAAQTGRDCGARPSRY